MSAVHAVPSCINVHLCGSLSRDDCKRLCDLGARSALATVPTSRANLSLTVNPTDPTTPSFCDRVRVIPCHAMENASLRRLMEPPAWAAPARGLARLEPVGECIGRQLPVDLTVRPSFQIGRSPSCDIQLYHATSSRRHAILFHHTNGTCYVVDCGSAHGTYVNGVRVSTPQVNGQIIPCRVRRGALIRFGGFGAPSFVLKSFQNNLDHIREPGLQLVRRNTRINALGVSSQESMLINLSSTISKALDVVCRKRSFDSMDSTDMLNVVTSCSEDSYDESSKRLRCSSPPLADEAPIRLVSPDIPAMMLLSCGHRRRVHFSPDPPRLFYPAVISPDASHDEYE